MINTLFAYTIAFSVPVWDIEIEVFRPATLLKELVNAGHRRSSVYVVVAKHKYFFALANGCLDTFNCFIHILHQPGTMQVGELRTKELFCLIESFDAPLHQHFA